MPEKKYIEYMVKMAAISKIGMQYTTDPYAMDNFEEISRLSNEMIKDFMHVNYESGNVFEGDRVPTPQVSIIVVVFDDDRNVLFQQHADTYNWTLPGGFSELYESPIETARRRCREEAGADTEIVRLVGVVDRRQFQKKHDLPEFVILFEGRLSTPLRKPSLHSIIGSKFFGLNDLPLIDDRTSEEEVARYINAAYNRDTIFD